MQELIGDGRTQVSFSSVCCSEDKLEGQGTSVDKNGYVRVHNLDEGAVGSGERSTADSIRMERMENVLYDAMQVLLRYLQERSWNCCL